MIQADQVKEMIASVRGIYLTGREPSKFEPVEFLKVRRTDVVALADALESSEEKK